MQHDTTREIRSIILLTMPCPPMPMLMSREVAGEVSYVEYDCVACNSHDLIAHLLTKVASDHMCSVAVHKRRKEYQKTASDALNKRFDDWRLENPAMACPPLEMCHSFFAEFTRAYIQSFMVDPTKILDIRITPATDVDKHSMLHTKTLDFAKAQNIMFGALPEHDVENMSYSEFLQLSAKRILLPDGIEYLD
jgi:hypothetical protein